MAERQEPVHTDYRQRRIKILGCHVDNLTMEETLEVVAGMIARGQPAQQVSVNVDKLVKAGRDKSLREIINSFPLISPDGMPVVWASRLLGKPLKERVAGIDLFESLLLRASQQGWRVFLLGAREEVIRTLGQTYPVKYPGLNIVGCRNGYWTPDEEEQVVETIRAARPDLLFVAITSPKKEQFLGKWQSHMRVPFAMGVGGSFDVAAGLVSRAPRWMQKIGLEWFHRFLCEPRRMFRRYFIEDMAFVGMLMRELVTRRRADQA